MKKSLLGAIAVAVTIVLWFAGQQRNPPGFFLDESSIAYNAWTIATHGVDEYGIAHPLYFRAFGEYKNPTYIYALAGLYRVLPPTDLTARRFSTVLGVFAAIALALLAWRMTRRRWIALVTFLTAMSTPMLIEIGRLAFEVALFPLTAALFLLAAWEAYRRPRWSPLLVAALTLSLTLLSYTYSAGRMVGPLLAGLVVLFFFTRQRLAAIVAMLAAYGVLTIVPMLWYDHKEHGALRKRASDVTFLHFIKTHPADTTAKLEQMLLTDLGPIGMAVRGDPNPRHHCPGTGGSILAMTFLLAGAGLVAIFRAAPRDRWWLFVASGALVSLFPAMIANDERHTLRMAAYPVFLIVLSIAALERPSFRKGIAIALTFGVLQTAWFWVRFQHFGPMREEPFDYGARTVVFDAAAQPLRPLYAVGDNAIHPLWYGVRAHLPADQIKRAESDLLIPPGSLVFHRGDPPPDATVVSRRGGFCAYITPSR